MKYELRAFGQNFQSVAELAVQYGVSASALSQRLRNGEAPEAAVNALLPIMVHGRPFKTVKSVADFYKVPEATLRHRVKKLGMSYEDGILLPVKALETGPVVVAGREYKSFVAAAKAHGKDPESARQRLKSGMTA